MQTGDQQTTKKKTNERTESTENKQHDDYGNENNSFIFAPCVFMTSRQIEIMKNHPMSKLCYIYVCVNSEMGEKDIKTGPNE